MNKPTIFAEGLVKSFGAIEALKGIDLSVDRGTVLGLLGPNGAGKTTAIRILTTLLAPDAGRAEVAGFDVVSQASRLRSVIGLTGQYSAVDDNMTGFENLELVGRLYHLGRARARERAEELLDRFDLAEAGHRQAKTYSGGMRRRLDLAASLVAAPQVIFLDEPTTGLDPRSRRELWDVLRGLVVAGATALLTTQYMEEADRLADRIAVIDYGQIIAEGTSAELKSRVGGDVVHVSITDPARLPEALDALKGLEAEAPKVDETTKEITLALSDGVSLLPRVVRSLDSAGVVLADLGVRRPTLDDVFLALTGHAAEDQEQKAVRRRRQSR